MIICNQCLCCRKIILMHDLYPGSLSSLIGSRLSIEPILVQNFIYKIVSSLTWKFFYVKTIYEEMLLR